MMDTDTKFFWLEMFSLIVIIILIIVGVNSCSASNWNDGICPKCEIRYELRGASQGLKYYACPNCGNEVSRY